MSDQTLPIVASAALANDDMENFMVAATPGGIEAQEAQGQRVFVNSETLPRKYNGGTREDLEQMGVKFGEAVDDLFQRVELPAGWKKVPTDHSMGSRLVDDKGRVRASIFYKAAFYDRDAYISLMRFHIIETEYLNDAGEVVGWDDYTQRQYFVRNADGAVLFESTTFGKRDYSAAGIAIMDCRKWLEENRPKWEEVTAYWNETTAPSEQPDAV